VRWLKPVRPGDILQARLTILECISSKSRPNMGILRTRGELFNQSHEMVLSLVGTHFLVCS